MAQIAREGLEAVAPVVVREADSVEDGLLVGGGQRVEFVTDYDARLKAATFITHMVEGTPVARQLNVSADWKDIDADRRETLLGSDAAHEALADIDVLEIASVENEGFTSVEHSDSAPSGVLKDDVSASRTPGEVCL